MNNLAFLIFIIAVPWLFADSQSPNVDCLSTTHTSVECHACLAKNNLSITSECFRNSPCASGGMGDANSNCLNRVLACKDQLGFKDEPSIEVICSKKIKRLIAVIW